MLSGFDTFSPAIFHANHLVYPSNRGEYESSEAIDLLIRRRRTIDAIGLGRWRVERGTLKDGKRADAVARREPVLIQG